MTFGFLCRSNPSDRSGVVNASSTEKRTQGAVPGKFKGMFQKCPNDFIGIVGLKENKERPIFYFD